MPDENQRPKGEYLIIQKPKGGFSSPFFEALMRFQYGETAEESNQGLGQMIEAAAEQMPGAVKKWEQGIWEDLYHGETSLNGKLSLIGERLGLEFMPVLKTPEEKWAYLAQLEDQYYDMMFRKHHDY